MKPEKTRPNHRPPVRHHASPIGASRRAILGGIILLIGIGLFFAIKSLKRPPQIRSISEPQLTVEGIIAQRADHPVTIRGYGEAMPLQVVDIAPEVPGIVRKTHPRLRSGERIPAGEVLFEIDTRDYEAALDTAQASVAIHEAAMRRLDQEKTIDAERLETLSGNVQLAQREYDRLNTLYTSHAVGTQSAVEQAQRQLIQARDQAAVIARAVALYPELTREAEARLSAAQAQLAQAELNLERCTVQVDFSARIKRVDVEAGESVQPGMNILTVANDNLLELHVPLDSRDGRRWLSFDNEAEQTGGTWFPPVPSLPCEIRWTEDMQASPWQGHLHRVVRFDAQTRMMVVAVRVTANEARPARGKLPLVEGMFCAVDIPGQSLTDVFKIPRAAVSFENTVYLNVSNRLKTVDVTVERIDNSYAYLSDGITDGDKIVVTRLIAPLENALLDWSAREDVP